MVYSFSIKDSRRDDVFEVDKLKAHCVKYGINFSDLVVKAIKAYDYSKER